MSLTKVDYKDKSTIISAENLNEIQDAILKNSVQIDNLAGDVSRLRTTDSTLSDQVASLAGRTSSLETSLESQTQLISNTQKRVGTLENSVGEIKDDISYLNSIDNNLREQANELALRISSLENNNIPYLENWNREQEEKIINLTTDTADLDERVDGILGTFISRTVQGEGSIAINDGSTSNVLGFNIYGKTTQNGTPTPSSPVDLNSVACGKDFTVQVVSGNKGRRMVFDAPEYLHGIPVSSGGNYTDASGQQWICDEIDFARGVYVQRVKSLVLSSKNSNIVIAWGGEGGFVVSMIGIVGIDKCVMCDKLSSHRSLDIYRGEQGTNVNIGYDQIVFAINGITTIDELKTWLQTNSLTFLFALSAPIETPLHEDVIDGFARMRTYKDNNEFSNSASADMKVEYIVDTKRYIDSIVISGGGAAPTKLTNITLRASAWVGSDSLYSQVVSLNGITEYSKVDLLPSVEQLAIFHNKDVTFTTDNEDGVVTAYAIGDKPTQDYTIQASITEVAV